MRILFTPFAQPNSYFAMTTLAWACRAAGHEVRVAGQPYIVEAITKSGMTAVPVGAAYDYPEHMADYRRRAQEAAAQGLTAEKVAAMAPEERRRLNNENVFVSHVKTAEAMAADLVPFVRSWTPDLVVADPLILAAPIVAETAGAVLVHHLWGPDLLRSMGFPGVGLDPRDWPGYLTDLYAKYGTPARADYAAHTVDVCPPSIQTPGIPNLLPVRYVPYNGSPGIVPDWLWRPAERPRVCVSWGTLTGSLMGSDGFVVPQIVKSLARADVEIVVAVKHSDRPLLGDPPEGVQVVEDLPLNLLMPSCDAIIHHGGAGTMLTAAVSSVVQVMVAGMTDQPFNASRLAATGAGVALRMGEVDADEIAAETLTVMADDGRRAAARRLREEIFAQPAPAGVVGTLAELV